MAKARYTDAEIEKILKKASAGKSTLNRHKIYYLRHRKRRLAEQNDYYQEHREERLRYQKKYDKRK